MKLYGSIPSPFVRRIRMVLHKHVFEFINIDIFSPEGKEILFANNPARKVPMFEDDGQMIFDSRVIFRYLQGKLGLSDLMWPQENALTLIDAATDSLVELLLCTRSGFDVTDDKLFFNLQKERIASVFYVLEQLVVVGEFEHWDYPAICLYSLLDWSQFRELADISDYPNLVAFWQANQQREDVVATDPRS